MDRLTSDKAAFVEKGPCLLHKLACADDDGPGGSATHGVRLPKRNKTRQDRTWGLHRFRSRLKWEAGSTAG